MNKVAALTAAAMLAASLPTAAFAASSSTSPTGASKKCQNRAYARRHKKQCIGKQRPSRPGKQKVRG